jgi:hypothetical protein
LVTRSQRVLGLALLASGFGWAIAHGIDGGALFLAPAVLLALPLLLGRYVGEERMVALLRPVRRARAVRAPRRVGASRPPLVIHRGGELIARSLAVRPPPLLTV